MGMFVGRVVAAGGVCAALVAPGVASATTTPTAVEAFVATVEPLPDAVVAEMSGVSWHDGCPVGVGDLRQVSMPYRALDGAVRRGELVVHAAVAADVASAFGRLFTAGFPIARMDRVEAFGGDDDVSMAAGNTSAFNCREITGGGAFSIHSWGMAIDVNPIENPYVNGSTVLPVAGLDFLDRTDVRAGMVVAGDATVAAFAAAGFEWGGDWSRLRDYQHFEIPDPEAVAAGYSAPERADGAAPIASCSADAPDSSVWTGDVWALVDISDGDVDVSAFNEFLAAGPVDVAGPCDAVRVLLHLDRADPQPVVTVVETQPVAGGATVIVTLDGLLDDSVAAVRYTFEMTAAPGAPMQITSGAWAQRCQPDRGHQDFSARLCV